MCIYIYIPLSKHLNPDLVKYCNSHAIKAALSHAKFYT